ncbi:hypothetical protein AK812_SmicGene45639, partial [Symbiodinium microadriaticum]
ALPAATRVEVSKLIRPTVQSDVNPKAGAWRYPTATAAGIESLAEALRVFVREQVLEDHQATVHPVEDYKPLPETTENELLDREEELSQFTEWSWQFKQYVRVISPNMFALLETVESDLEVENDHSIMSDEDVEMSKQLYALLASLLRERPVQILKAITDGNGCEVWRTLVRTLAPSSKARSLALLGAISQFPMMTNSNYHEQILKLEELCRKYEQSSSKTVDAELKAAILLRSLPASLRTHVSVNCSESATYDQLREVILRYERATQKWTTQLVSGPSTSATDTSAPMEIDQVWNAKGKHPKGKGKGGDGWRQPHHPKGGKDPKGKGKHYNQDYMKGKFGKPKGSPKGGKDGKGKSKGFQNDYGKGKGKGKTSVPYNNCKICGKPGHWSNECWMKKVNQVNNPGSGSQNATPPSSSHAGTPSVSSQFTTTATVKRRLARWEEFMFT